MIRLRKRRRPAGQVGELERVHRRLDELEERAERAVDQVTDHGRRNGFADRWRQTLPPRRPREA